MTVQFFSLLIALALSGCASLSSLMDVEDYSKQEQNIELQEPLENGPPLASSISFQKQFNPRLPAEDNNMQTSNTVMKTFPISHYVEVLMQELVNNLRHFDSATPVAIVSFVMLDSNYNKSNLLGIQIAESLIHEVHKFGIPVIDFKTTEYVRVTPQGDFVFSKMNEDLSPELAAHYVIGGTMSKHKDGYLINARIVNLQSKVVKATAQITVPHDVASAVLPSSTNIKVSTVQLIKDK
jgi:TolB-like protein